MMKMVRRTIIEFQNYPSQKIFPCHHFCASSKRHFWGDLIFTQEGKQKRDALGNLWYSHLLIFHHLRLKHQLDEIWINYHGDSIESMMCKSDTLWRIPIVFCLVLRVLMEILCIVSSEMQPRECLPPGKDAKRVNNNLWLASDRAQWTISALNHSLC